jgi:hypothetical protein
MNKHIGRRLLNCNSLKESIRCIALERMSDLRDDKDLTAEEILGDYAWSMLGPGEPSLVGKCLKELVEEGALPLYRVQGIHEYPLLYRKRISA